MAWLQREFPELKPRYEGMYANHSYAGTSSRAELDRRMDAILRQIPRRTTAEARVTRQRWKAPATHYVPEPQPAVEQITLNIAQPG